MADETRVAGVHPHGEAWGREISAAEAMPAQGNAAGAQAIPPTPCGAALPYLDSVGKHQHARRVAHLRPRLLHRSQVLEQLGGLLVLCAHLHHLQQGHVVVAASLGQ